MATSMMTRSLIMSINDDTDDDFEKQMMVSESEGDFGNIGNIDPTMSESDDQYGSHFVSPRVADDGRCGPPQSEHVSRQIALS